MPEPSPEVVCLGNAIVDVLGRADEAVLAAHGLAKGATHPVGDAAAGRLLAALDGPTASAGGSAANTAAGLGLLGIAAAFVGKVGADADGARFVAGMAAAGVACPVPPSASARPTSRCVVAVTPDGERTMATRLGACRELGPDDLPAGMLAGAALVLVEGYAWTVPGQRAAALRAAELARGARVALTLSDPAVAAAHRPAFADLVRSGRAAIGFANAREACAFAGTEDPGAAIAALREMPGTWFVTLGADGCVVVAGGAAEAVPAHPAGRPVDTTGAGDAFAAGTLAGLARGLGPARAAGLGALVAAHVVGRVGARPAADLAGLARAGGFGLDPRPGSAARAPV